jgi:hypothetical protein
VVADSASFFYDTKIKKIFRLVFLVVVFSAPIDMGETVHLRKRAPFRKYNKAIMLSDQLSILIKNPSVLIHQLSLSWEFGSAVVGGISKLAGKARERKAAKSQQQSGGAMQAQQGSRRLRYADNISLCCLNESLLVSSGA